MNNMRKHTVFLTVLLLVSSLCFVSGAELNSEQAIACLCGAPSALPEEEVAVSLPDGFFSQYEAKHGYVYAPDDNMLPNKVGEAFLYRNQHDALGEVVIALNQMERESPYVYATDGSIKVTMNGQEQILSMDTVDYVCDAGDNDLCYRLACTPESGCDSNIDQVYALCYSCKENQSVLVGSLSYFSQKGELEVSYPFFITGRNEFEAERHLQKKITVATAY
ncbi:hypothetical protein [uncultured Sphaerochaeta sp.]|uniref:hypothetical protein n=1 Tax=uncultured Sphaerochaeta sp. TaxID=886478 RepID=UPI0029CA92F7|nr:hypothetical protein [uncultured Sphaerochaeta sp.]